jgi:hypothetical protein
MLPWLLLLAWAALQILIAWRLDIQRRGPIDFLTYQIASDKIARGETPYGTIAEDLAIWRAYHELEEHWREPAAPEPPVRPGPYLYPPTLALIIAQAGIGPVAFTVGIVLSVAAFVWIWLNVTGMDARWLLLVVLSWDVFASATGGNVELVILGSTMVAARILWSAQPVLAAPFVAFVLLVKPFYVLFFVAFVALMWSTQHHTRRSARACAATAITTLVLIGVELYRWSPALRLEALEFMRHGIQHQWFVLPLAEQTPMSVWNRTSMQGLVNAGLSPSLAFPVAVTLWCAFAVVTTWRVSRHSLEFSGAFALAFVLLYWGRPVGWTLNYLEIIVAAACWPSASHRMRKALIIGAVAVMVSHWLALVLTARRVTLRLFTLQSAEFPWESWLLVPLCWLLLLNSAGSTDGRSRREPNKVRNPRGVEEASASSTKTAQSTK